MIALTPKAHVTLRRIVEAGPNGMSTDDLAMGDTLGLALEDLVEIEGRQVTATAKGRAFSMRTAA